MAHYNQTKTRVNDAKNSTLSFSMTVHAPTPCVWGTVTCISKPMCSCQLNQFLGVDMSCQVWTLCKAFRKWNCFGDDVVAEQPSHSCLLVYDTVCHVTPCIFLSSEPWLKQCSFKKCSLCLWNKWIHRQSICLCEKHPQWFHKPALKVHMIHCDSHATLAPICLL